ncbi:MAG: bifunctional folylpolyglutamate synthase/dihydrofolate synthase [Halioglobus sp.]|nr:bifunctional folylpolyglutamate synthase/dihydrofolate synthase [Halioglobus sp.]
MSSATLASWLARIEQLHPEEIELGLDRVRSVAQRLELLPLAVPAVTVAGTNGKGSTVAVMEAVLVQSGTLVGAYTSPHFLRFNERIRVGGKEVTDSEIVAAFEAIEHARGETSLTYFEFATLAALAVFRAREVAVVLLEVGLGGRLDAVNIVDASVSVITAIALDHQDWLGDSLADIAREKAGVLRAGRPVIVSDPAPPAALWHAVEQIGAAPLYRLGQEFEVTAADDWCFRLAGGGGGEIRVAANAALLPANVAGALQALAVLDRLPQNVAAAVAGAAPRGRREALCVAGREYVLDVAHNPASVLKLVAYLSATHCNGRTIAVFSVMRDKDAGAMIESASSAVDAWFLADQPDNPRAERAAELAALLRARGATLVSVSDNVRQAFRRAQTVQGEEDRVVVFGSFFTVAAVMGQLEKDAKRYGAQQ